MWSAGVGVGDHCYFQDRPRHRWKLIETCVRGAEHRRQQTVHTGSCAKSAVKGSYSHTSIMTALEAFVTVRGTERSEVLTSSCSPLRPSWAGHFLGGWPGARADSNSLAFSPALYLLLPVPSPFPQDQLQSHFPPRMSQSAASEYICPLFPVLVRVLQLLYHEPLWGMLSEVPSSSHVETRCSGMYWHRE